MFALCFDKSPGTLEQEHVFDFSHEGRLIGGEAGTQRLFISCPLVHTLSPAHTWASWQAPQTCLQSLYQEAQPQECSRPEWDWLNRTGRAGWCHLGGSSRKFSLRDCVPLLGWGAQGSAGTLLFPCPMSGMDCQHFQTLLPRSGVCPPLCLTLMGLHALGRPCDG